MPDLPAFPDVEKALIDVFADLSAAVSATAVARLPPDLQQMLPVIRVRRLGGGDDRWTDSPRADVEVYAATRAVAVPLAELLRQRLLSGPHATGHGVIDRAVTEVGPQEIPYEDQDIRLVTATYRVALRRS